MFQDQERDPEKLLVAAREGRSECLSALLQLYGNYLRAVAAIRMDDRLRSRCSASDVVQETLLNAYRDFPHFRGRTKAEFLGWLRQILVNTVLRMTERHVGTEKRAVRREISLDTLQAVSRRSGPGDMLADRGASPSSLVGRDEAADILLNQLGNLPPDYREVLILRHFQGLSFAEVGTRMSRSAGAVRMLWLRAIEQMHRLLENRGVA